MNEYLAQSDRANIIRKHMQTKAINKFSAMLY